MRSWMWYTPVDSSSQSTLLCDRFDPTPGSETPDVAEETAGDGPPAAAATAVPLLLCDAEGGSGRSTFSAVSHSTAAFAAACSASYTG
jgi:hypothetical protein